MRTGIRADPERMLAKSASTAATCCPSGDAGVGRPVGKHSAHDQRVRTRPARLDQGPGFRAALRPIPGGALPDAELDELLEVRPALGSCAAS